MVSRDTILLGLSYLIWCTVGFVFAISFMYITVEMTYTNEFLDEQKEQWMACGEAWQIVEDEYGGEFSLETKFSGCEILIDRLNTTFCEECEKV